MSCLAAVAAPLLRLLWVSATRACACLLHVDFCFSSAACSLPSSNLPVYQLLLLLWPNLCLTRSRTSLQRGTSMTDETTPYITPSHGSLNVFVWGFAASCYLAGITARDSSTSLPKQPRTTAPEYLNCFVQRGGQLQLAISPQRELPILGTGVCTTTVHTLRTSLHSH